MAPGPFHTPVPLSVFTHHSNQGSTASHVRADAHSQRDTSCEPSQGCLMQTAADRPGGYPSAGAEQKVIKCHNSAVPAIGQSLAAQQRTPSTTYWNNNSSQRTAHSSQLTRTAHSSQHTHQHTHAYTQVALDHQCVHRNRHSTHEAASNPVYCCPA